MKECCMDIWYETNVAIRMITWEHTRSENGEHSQDEFPISYTCPTCGNKWSNINGVLCQIADLS